MKIDIISWYKIGSDYSVITLFFIFLLLFSERSLWACSFEVKYVI